MKSWKIVFTHLGCLLLASVVKTDYDREERRERGWEIWDSHPWVHSTRSPEPCGLGVKQALEPRFCPCSFEFCIRNGQFSSIIQSCLTLCDPMDCSMPGFPVHCQLSKTGNLFENLTPLPIAVLIFPGVRVLLFPWRAGWLTVQECL